MRVSEINKEIEKGKKWCKGGIIFMVVLFAAVELFELWFSYKIGYYDGELTFMMLVIVVPVGVFAYINTKKSIKPLIEKRTKLEQDEQFIKRRVGIYEAADDEQKKQLSGAYFDVNEAYQANFREHGFGLLSTNKDADEEKSQFHSLWNRRDSSRRHSTWIYCPS